MRRLLLSTTLFVMLLLGSAHAAEDAHAADNQQLNITLTCSIASDGSIGCFLERPVLVVGNLELALGVDARAALWGESPTYLSGYAVVAWYEPTWNAWAELAIPEVVPVIGRPTAFRAGFTIRF